MVNVVCASTVLLAFLLSCTQVSACNEAVCASIVSKCMLTQSCKCDVKNCTCCKDCFNCLDGLYYECCSCVDICPKSNNSYIPLSRSSNVGDNPHNVSALFNALTSDEDHNLRWVSYHYPIHQDLSFFSPTHDKQIKFIAVSAGSPSQDIKEYEEETINCTVAFQTNCISSNKCLETCKSMGAARFRWFHDGCCECIGDTCLNYGINVNKCLNCPARNVDSLDEYDDEMPEIESNDTGEGNSKAMAEDVLGDEYKKPDVKKA